MDPDPYWIRIKWGAWFRIEEGKNDPEKIENGLQISCFEVLDVLF
jgi:hypothetical protein